MRKLLWLAILLSFFACNSFAAEHEKFEDVPPLPLFNPMAPPVVTITFFTVADIATIPNPGNPPAGKIRIYADSTTGNFTCLTSTGASCAGGGSGAPTNAIDPTTSALVTPKVKADVVMCRDTNAKFTTTTSVTCLTANFTSADVGKAIFGTCCGLQGGLNHPASVLVLPQGTITVVNSATNVTVSGAGNSTICAAGATNCLLLWGTDDTAAWDAAWIAATGTAGRCSPLVFAGFSFLKAGRFLSTTCNIGITGPSSQGAGIFGYGYKGSMFIILPNSVGTDCTGTGGGVTTNVCFGPGKGFQLVNLGMWGGENGNSNVLNGKILWDMGIDAYMTNVLLAGFASGSAGGCTGVQVESSGQTFITLVVDGFCSGATPNASNPQVHVVGGNYTNFVQSFSGNTGGMALVIDAGAIVGSSQGFYGGLASTGPVLQQNGTFYSSRDIFSSTGGAGGGANIVTGPNSRTYLDLDILVNTAQATNSALFFNSATSKVWARNTSFQGGAANLDINVGVMGTFFDQGGNTFVTGVAAGTILPTCAMTTGGGAGPACVLVAGSTNEKGTIRMTPGAGPGATGTTTLTFRGTFAGAANTTPDCNFSYANTGTGAWSLTTTTPIIMTTRSSTVPVFNWNQTGALTAASTYDIDYVCVAR